MAKLHRFIDIGANLTDSMFRGIYHGSQKHNGDLSEVLKRAWNASLDKIIVTSGCIQDVEDALMLVSSDARLYTTVGCHPTRCNEFEEHGPEKYLERLESFVSNNKSKVVALGEFGLDYDRLQFCSKGVQLKYCEMQLSLSEKFKLPLFLHCRNSASDLLDVLSRNRDKIYGGVVHSFTGTLSEAQKFIDFGLHIGINGCSLKTDENLEVVKNLPLDKLLIETDAPWCEIKPTHAGFKYIKTHFSSKKKEKFETGFCVKGRNEPALIVQILEIIAQLKSEDPFMLSKQIFENTTELFKFY